MVSQADEDCASLRAEDEVSQEPGRDLIWHISYMPENRIFFLAFVNLQFESHGGQSKHIERRMYVTKGCLWSKMRYGTGCLATYALDTK